ncbi:MAG TPA: tryptophan 7-halogenase [Bryobacteraceae bacterium]|nr:tryptophan 7-halogenase [Bryobacteraceae bacterium]
MIRRTVDVLVVGSGPAGATAALNLAPYRSVLMIEASAQPLRRIGESLLPAAVRLLRDMGLADSFIRLGMLPWHRSRSVWAGPCGHDTDFTRGAEGHGWHIDRVRFESFLRLTALERGAELLSPATLQTVAQENGRFLATLQTDSGAMAIDAGALVDAGGRRSPVGRRLGARRRTDLPLVGAGTYGSSAAPGVGAGTTFTEAVSDGWWYTAPLPGNRRVVAFHTDADNRAAVHAGTKQGLLRKARQTVELGAMLEDGGFVADENCFRSPASGSRLDPCAGAGWLAVGDAALTFDPLSSQGLLNALFLGRAAAEALRSENRSSAITEYKGTVDRIRSAYCRGLSHCYRLEHRWPDEPFWARRRAI